MHALHVDADAFAHVCALAGAYAAAHARAVAGAHAAAHARAVALAVGFALHANDAHAYFGESHVAVAYHPAHLGVAHAPPCTNDARADVQVALHAKAHDNGAPQRRSHAPTKLAIAHHSCSVHCCSVVGAAVQCQPHDYATADHAAALVALAYLACSRDAAAFHAGARGHHCARVHGQTHVVAHRGAHRIRSANPRRRIVAAHVAAAHVIAADQRVARASLHVPDAPPDSQAHHAAALVGRANDAQAHDAQAHDAQAHRAADHLRPPSTAHGRPM